MKKKLGQKPIIFPMPAVLIGTYRPDGNANAMTAAWAAACCHQPPCLGVAIRHNRQTFENLKNKKAFTVNVPSCDQVDKVDYLGMVSGKEQPDKLDIASIVTSHGDKVDAPLLISCPVNVECQLVDRISLGSHSWFIGEVCEIHVDEEFVKDSQKIDVAALNPLMYLTSQAEYFELGNSIAKAYSAGEKIKKS